jgi:hypothetical protein
VITPDLPRRGMERHVQRQRRIDQRQGILNGFSDFVPLLTKLATRDGSESVAMPDLPSSTHPSLPLDCSEPPSRIDPAIQISFPATKNRLLLRSIIRALDFKAEFRRSAVCSVSATIGTYRSTFPISAEIRHWARKTVNTPLCRVHRLRRQILDVDHV